MERLTRRQLNRATLARQMLLRRANDSAVTAVERLMGMQTQEPRPPFIGLWTRLTEFDRQDLLQALPQPDIARDERHRLRRLSPGAATGTDTCHEPPGRAIGRTRPGAGATGGEATAFGAATHLRRVAITTGSGVSRGQRSRAGVLRAHVAA